MGQIWCYVLGMTKSSAMFFRSQQLIRPQKYRQSITHCDNNGIFKVMWKKCQNCPSFHGLSNMFLQSPSSTWNNR